MRTRPRTRIEQSRDGRALNAGPDTLRARLKAVPEYEQRFEEACSLWDSLFVDDHVHYPIAPALEKYVARNQCEAVEDLLEKLIYGSAAAGLLPVRSFVPTARESLLLVTAAWLQNLGLMHGLFRNERHLDTTEIAPTEIGPAKLERLAAKRGQRASHYLQKEWKLFCAWSDEDRKLLADLCRCAVAGAPLDELPIAPDMHAGLARNERSVHLQMCVALLRLANNINIRGDFCPLDLRQRLKPVATANVPESAFLQVLTLIEEVEINHGMNAVTLRARFPTPVDLEVVGTEDGLRVPLTLDLLPGLEYLRMRLHSIISEVAHVLSGCASTRILCATLERLDGDSLMEVEQFTQEVWALQLAATTCATEAACVFGLIIDRLLRDELAGEGNRDIPLRQKLLTKCKAAREIHPMNVLPLRLAILIERAVATWPENEAPSTDKIETLRDHVHAFLHKRMDQSGQLTLQGQTRRWSATDTPVVYGVSRNVLKFLESTGFKGQLLAVSIDARVRRPESNWRDLDNPQNPLAGEDARLIQWCRERGIDCHFVDERELPIRMRATRQRLVFIAGARSFLAAGNDPVNRDPAFCYSTIGNFSIAQTVRGVGGCVWLIAEAGKKADVNEQAILEANYTRSLDDPECQIYQQVDQLDLARHVDDVISPSN